MQDGQCYRLLGSPLLRPADIETKFVTPSLAKPSTWAVTVNLRPDAGKRLDGWARSHIGADLALVDGSIVLAAFPLFGPGSFRHFGIDDNWTEGEARLVLRALGGTDDTSKVTPAPT